MNSLRYVPGEWYALVTGENVVLLPAATSAEQVNGLWAKLAGATTVEALLSELLSLHRMDIAALPNFALVSRERSPHVVLRGAPELVAQGPDGEQKVSGAGIATWAERKLSASGRWNLVSGSAAPEHSFALPIQAGIVRVSSLELTCDSEQVQVAPESAAPAQQPIAAPATGEAPAKQAPVATGLAGSNDAAAIEGNEPAAQEVAASGQEPQAGPAGTAESEAAPISSVPGFSSAPAEESVPSQSAEPSADAQQPPEEPAAAGPASEAADETPATATEPEAEKPAAADEAPASSAQTASEATPAAAAAPRNSPFAMKAPKPAAVSEATVAPAPSFRTVSAEEADDDSTFIPGGRNRDQDSGVNEDTQDPEDYGQGNGDSEPSLGSMLLGARGAADTQYDTGQGDDSDTIIKPRSAGALAAPAAADEEPDEHTIIRGIKASSPAPKEDGEPKDGTESQVAITEFILARICSQRHPNPPTSAACRHCGEQLSGPAQQVRKPAMGRMIVRDQGGAREFAHALNRSVVLGRQPSASAVKAENTPRLLQVDSPSGDISRSHLHVRLEGWHVQLVDLGATNGTVLLREGQTPHRLSKNQEIMLVNGDVADLGDGVSLRFEDLP